MRDHPTDRAFSNQIGSTPVMPVRRPAKAAGAVLVAVALATGGWTLGRASVHRTTAASVRPAPPWLRYPFTLEPPQTAGQPIRRWDPAQPSERWILEGTDPRRGIAIVRPDVDNACVQFGAHVGRSSTRVRVVVKQLAMSKDQVLCGSVQTVRYGIPFDIEVPLDGRSISGPGYEPRPPAKWFTVQSRWGRVVTIPSVVGLSLRQARDVLGRTGHPVTPQSPDIPAEGLVVTKQSVPGWAVFPAADRTPIALTTNAR